MGCMTKTSWCNSDHRANMFLGALLIQNCSQSAKFNSRVKCKSYLTRYMKRYRLQSHDSWLFYLHAKYPTENLEQNNAHATYLAACTCDWSPGTGQWKWVETTIQCCNIIAVLVSSDLRLLPGAWGSGVSRRITPPVWPIFDSSSGPRIISEYGDLGHDLETTLTHKKIKYLKGKTIRVTDRGGPQGCENSRF
jgi:hypothetical protein